MTVASTSCRASLFSGCLAKYSATGARVLAMPSVTPVLRSNGDSEPPKYASVSSW